MLIINKIEPVFSPFLFLQSKQTKNNLIFQFNYFDFYSLYKFKKKHRNILFLRVFSFFFIILVVTTFFARTNTLNYEF
ncbi:hypothetical protein AsAng_0020230 [Aureispira anguillae]|uniref:Uncharacterized protein n=1 Tax=Aureispira anguillae TaxID=2864201 RepID=A0A915YE30_9BACT|nr:hypothetical protein AsAng_0020230 [Aureispira anguillae]